MAKLLKLVASGIKMPACEKFVAKNEFRTGRSDINLWMSERFQEKFLGKVEESENVEATTLRTHKLLKSSRDPGIIAELDGKEETTLCCLFTLIMKQANSGNGDLLTNGHVNIFYIRDINNELWAVCALRFSGGWVLRASSVERSREWNTGRLVVSREDA